jgi:hypothetical protein
MRKITPKSKNENGLDSISPRRPSGYTPEPVYPRIHLCEMDNFPEMEDWKVGEEYTLSMKIKMVGMNKDKYSSCGDFEIRAIETEEDADEK